MIPSGRCLLAVPLTDHHTPLERQARAAREQGADLLELRLDRLDPVAVAAALPVLRDLPLLLTVRERDEGGDWQGLPARKLDLLERFAPYAAWVDVELALWERSDEVRDWCANLVAQSGTRPRLIMSWHDFREPDPAATGRMAATQARLEQVLERMRVTPAEAEKLVCYAADVQESLAALAVTRGERPRIVLAMGPAGLPSRVLTAGRGGLLTFAKVHGAGSAPGQPDLDELRDVYRIAHLTARTPVLGVIGWPVTHSLSPWIHNRALAEQGRAGVYLPLAVAPHAEALDTVLEELLRGDRFPVRGCSVTLPHKTGVLAWLEAHDQHVSEGAAACGAVNTLVRVPEGWRGENSDVLGVQAALAEAGWRADGPITLLGAGGVARAVLAALGSEAARVTIFNRTRSRAEELSSAFGCVAGAWSDRGAARGSLLVNCTSIGMYPRADELPLPAESIGQHGTVFDTIYTPARTQLLRVAEGAGCRTASGLTMFVAQAEQQYRWWFGQGPPRGSYRRTLSGGVSPGANA